MITKLEIIVTKRRVIRQWHNYISETYGYRQKMIFGSAYYHIQQQKKCLLFWNEFALKQKRLNENYLQFTKYINDKRKKTILSVWKQETQTMQLIEEIQPLLSDFANNLYPFKYFNLWRDRFVEIKTANS